MKKITHTLLLFLITTALAHGQAFVTTWKTDNPGTSNDDQITIPTGAAVYNYTVDWGDGSSDSGVTGSITHTYESPGTYTVAINGLFPLIYFFNDGDKDKILSVEHWGTGQWSSFRYSFWGCSNLQLNASDAPDLTNVTNMVGTFRQATNFNSNINHWDVSNVEFMNQMFFGAASFNQPLNDWVIDNVITTSAMFGGATSFNQALDNWNVGNVQDMSGMFDFATAFNQPIGNWNVEKVTKMNNMLRDNNFNQDISGWNTGEVTTMRSMFRGSSNFDQNLGNWDISKVTDMAEMFFQSGLTLENYDNILIGWAAQTVQSGISLDVSNVDYCAGSDARDILTSAPNNWTINDGDEYCIVNIPDANFKAVLLADTNINTEDDGEITEVEAEAYLGIIDVENLGINDLTGIEAFINITQLDANRNNLTSIDLSNNTALTHLFLWSNNLTSIDLSINTSITNLNLTSNALGTLDVSNQADLFTLQCQSCELTSLDVNSNPDLQYLIVNNNFIPAIDVSNNTLLHTLNVHINELSSLDISTNTVLQSLSAHGNSISSIDLSNNSTVRFVSLSGNPISSLDVSSNLLLEDLSVSNCLLVSLDVSANTALVELFAINNDLTELNVANGNNTNFVDLKITGNQNLSCVTVDDIAYAEANFLDIDGTTNFSTDCNVVNIPDDNFRNALLANASINTNDDAFIQVVEAEAYAGSIVVRELSITDLTGIEVFQNIDFLDCFGNELTTLDLTGNTSLVSVNCRDNLLTSIDATGLTTLEHFDFANNLMTTVDVSTNTGLLYLGCNGNQMTTLDVSNNSVLEDLSCYENNLTNLDVSSNPQLLYLSAYENSLTELDISANTLLVGFEVNNNNLTTINAANGNNGNFEYFTTTNNPNLTCITVDDIAFAEANFTDVDEVANFSTNCNNTANDIVTFSFPEQAIDAVIDVANHTVVIDVVSGTDFTNLTPTFTVSDGAIADPASGIAQDFSSAFVYTITAENPTAVQEWTITVREENTAPSDIALDNNTIDENNAVDAVIGTFSTTDADASDAHTYSLVAGAGDSDNASFDISGSDLIALEAFDFETKSSYSIRVQTNDGRAGLFEKEFTITVNDVIEQVAQTITFNAIDDQFLEASSVTLSATATSGLDLSFEIVSGPATLSGNVVSFSDLGTVVVQANQAGNGDFFAADPVEQSFEIITVTGVNDEASTLLIYPNPASDVLTVQTANKDVELKLLNINGSEVMTIRPNYTQSISHLERGIYFLRITSNQSATTHKIIKN